MEPIHPEVQRRRRTLRVVLLFTVPGAALFAFLNLQLGAPFLALLDLVLLIASLVLLLMLRRKAPLEHVALIYLPALFLNLFVVLARPDIHPDVYSWLTMIPYLPYLLLTPRLALWVTVVSLLMATVAYFAGAADAPHRLEPVSLANVFIPMLGFFVACHFYTHSRVRSEQDMVERILTDPLTTLGNREKLLRDFEHEQKRAQRTKMPLALFLIDLDHFKKLNDRYGHDAGDAALVYFANLLKSRMRATDLPYRIGGEEFVVLLPDTDTAGATKLAEDLCQTLASSRINHQGENISLTLSAGVVELGQHGDDWQRLYRAADARLYACKERGRNCVLNSLAAAPPAKDGTETDKLPEIQ